jgi:trimeric autotransporter adhesin
MKRKSMSKNLTRKGLAFGALVALGASVFAGAPAYAADTVVLAGNYSSDTTLATAVTGTYDLNASLAPGSVAANIAQLKYKVVAATGTIAAVRAYTYDSTGPTYATNGSALSTANDGTALYVVPTSASTTLANTLRLSITSVNGTNTSATTATQSVAVTAFIDANNNGLVDSAEAQQTQTVSFIKHSEITTATTIAAATAGDTTVTATVKFTNINNQSLTAANVGAYFTKGDGNALLADSAVTIASEDDQVGLTGAGTGYTEYTTSAAHGYVVGDKVTVDVTDADGDQTAAVIASVPTATTFRLLETSANAVVTTSVGTVSRVGRAAVVVNVVTPVAYSATNGGFKYTTGTVAALVKGSAVKVQPLLKTSALTSSDTTSIIGSAQTASVITRKVTTWTADTVTSVTALAATAAATVAATDVALNKEYQVEFEALDGATVPVGVASVPVAISVTSPDRTLTSAITLAVNGTTYTSNTALPGATGVAKIAATTDSKGKVTVTLKGTGLTAGDDIVVTAVAENFTAVITTNNAALTYTTTYVENAPTFTGTLGGSDKTTRVVTTDGSAAVLNVIVKDQFGGNAPDATYDVTATFNNALAGYAHQGASSTTASTTATGTYAAVTSGKATLTILDNGTGVGVNTYSIDLRPKSANGVYGTAVPVINILQVAIVSAADAAAGAVTLTATDCCGPSSC